MSQQHTAFLSKLIGLYCILVALAMVTHKEATVDTVIATLRNPSLMFVLGVITTGAGLALVLAHNVWSDGALAVTVTLVGWLSLAKGLLFLYLDPNVEANFFLNQLHYGQFFYLYMMICLALGIWLALGGFTSRLSKAVR